MALPVLGRDAYIAFRHNGNMVPYGCAINIEINFSMETKETKTIGDGVWGRSRGQKLGYTISMDGIIRFLPTTSPAAFDIVEYYRNMTDIEFMIIFAAVDHSSFEFEGERIIEGTALPINVTLSTGPDGHANAAFELQGNGEPDIRDAVMPCNLTIDTVEYLGESGIINFSITMVMGHQQATRFDYTMDGGGVGTKFVLEGLTKNVVISVPGTIGSSHELKIWPVCENGYDGPVYTLNFTKDN